MKEQKRKEERRRTERANTHTQTHMESEAFSARVPKASGIGKLWVGPHRKGMTGVTSTPPAKR